PMPVTGRPRTYHGDRPATPVERARRCRTKRLQTMPPGVVCRTFGSCTLYCSPWEPLYPFLSRQAAVITDPPYKTSYDYTKARRRPSHWDLNYAGLDQPFDPTPWLGFPEVVLFGANHYWDRLPAGGSWLYWDKTPGQAPSGFASGEWVWLSKA